MNYGISISGNSDFNNEMLKLHNEYRKTHHSGKLVLDPKVNIKILFIYSAYK